MKKYSLALALTLSMPLAANLINESTLGISNKEQIFSKQREQKYIENTTVNLTGEVEVNGDTLTADGYVEEILDYSTAEKKVSRTSDIHQSYNNSDSVHTTTDYYRVSSISSDGNLINIAWEKYDTSSSNYQTGCDNNHGDSTKTTYSGVVEYTYGSHPAYSLSLDDFGVDSVSSDYYKQTQQNLIDYTNRFTNSNRYSDLDNAIRTSLVSRDKIHLPTNDTYVLSEENTQIIYYSDIDGTSELNENDYIDSSDIYFKIKAVPNENNILGETDVLHYRITYIDEMFLDIPNSAANNTYATGYHIDGIVDDSTGGIDYSLIVNSKDSKLFLHDERINTMTYGGEEILPIDSQGEEYYYINLDYDPIDLPKRIVINNDYHITVYANGESFAPGPLSIIDDETGATPEHIISFNEEINANGNHVLSDVFLENNITINLADSLVHESQDWAYLIDSVYIDGVEQSQEKYGDLKIDNDAKHILTINDVFGNVETMTFEPYSDDHRYQDYFVDLPIGQLHLQDAQQRQVPHTSSVDDVVKHYSANQIASDRDNNFL